MPRYNVKHNDKWVCFSSICDGFITPLMDKADYENWRLEEYGKANYQPAEECNMMDFEEAVLSSTFNRSYDEALYLLIDIGIEKDEAEKLLAVNFQKKE